MTIRTDKVLRYAYDNIEGALQNHVFDTVEKLLLLSIAQSLYIIALNSDKMQDVNVHIENAEDLRD